MSLFLFLLLVLGGFLGAVRGAHKISGNFIDQSTQPIVEYAQSYLPEIQSFINNQMGTYQGQNVTIEDVIAGQLTKELDLDPTSYEYQAAFEINLTVINAYLTFADLPGSLDDLQGIDVTNLPPDVFYILPNSLHDVCDGFFFFKYIAVWGMFFPFLMIPIAEYLIFRIFGSTKVRTLPALPRRPQLPPLPQSDFV